MVLKMFFVVRAAVHHLLLVGLGIMMNAISDDWQQLTSRMWINGGQEEALYLQELN